MALIAINKNPSRKELLWFGAIFALFFGVIGALLLWKFDARTAAYVIWAAAGAVTVLYYIIPPVRRPLYLGWLYAAFPIGWVVTHLLLAIVFYLVFTPIGLIMRLCGRDPMQRRFNAEAASYWTARKPIGDSERYFRQF